MLRAVLIDVGGTLWPDAWPDGSDDDLERVARLRHAVPSMADSERIAEHVSF
jgi:hypothetical protein